MKWSLLVILSVVSQIAVAQTPNGLGKNLTSIKQQQQMNQALQKMMKEQSQKQPIPSGGIKAAVVAKTNKNHKKMAKLSSQLAEKSAVPAKKTPSAPLLRPGSAAQVKKSKN